MCRQGKANKLMSLFHPDFYNKTCTERFIVCISNRWLWTFTRSALLGSGRGLYRQWGISPRPEDISFNCFLPHYNML